MKVFLPGNTLQNLVVRPRKVASSVDLTIRQKLTDTSTTYSSLSASFSTNTGGLTVPFTHEFTEGETYEAELREAGGGQIWRGRFYVTAQVPQAYKLNG